MPRPVAGSSNGRTPDSGSGSQGSSPCPAASKTATKRVSKGPHVSRSTQRRGDYYVRVAPLIWREHGRPHWGVRAARAIAGRTAGDESGAAAPRDPARLRCATFVCRQKELAPPEATPTFHGANSVQAGRPDASRQSPCGIRRAVLSARARRSRLRHKPALPPSFE